MKCSVMAASLAVVFALASAPAYAKHHHHSKRATSALSVAGGCSTDNSGRIACYNAAPASGAEGLKGLVPNSPSRGVRQASLGASGDPRPKAWCGWWLRHYLGVADRAYNRASQWIHYGTNAHGPGSGVIVVWWHHVGIITGGSMDHWVVKSGNDGHAVQERERSLRGVIAYRLPNGIALR
jgi:hypothetical protein